MNLGTPEGPRGTTAETSTRFACFVCCGSLQVSCCTISQEAKKQRSKETRHLCLPRHRSILNPLEPASPSIHNQKPHSGRLKGDLFHRWTYSEGRDEPSLTDHASTTKMRTAQRPYRAHMARSQLLHNYSPYRKLQQEYDAPGGPVWEHTTIPCVSFAVLAANPLPISSSLRRSSLSLCLC